jgi:hypothetical protein
MPLVWRAHAPVVVERACEGDFSILLNIFLLEPEPAQLGQKKNTPARDSDSTMDAVLFRTGVGTADEPARRCCGALGGCLGAVALQHLILQFDTCESIK